MSKANIQQRVTAGCQEMMSRMGRVFPLKRRKRFWRTTAKPMAIPYMIFIVTMDLRGLILLGLDSDTFYIYHVAAVMVDNLRRLLLGINLSDKAIMDFDFPGVGFPV